MRAKAGFTLLEALIALAIAGIAMAAIFQMQHQLVNGQRLHEKAMEQASARRNALAVVKDINPDVTPTGDVELPPNQTLHWTSQALNNANLSAGFPSGDGQYYVTLYKVSVEVDGADGQPVDAFDVERMGWTSQAAAAAGGTGTGAAATR